MELQGKRAICLLGILLSGAWAPAVSWAEQGDFPALERHYSVDPSRNRRPAKVRWSAVVRHPRHTFLAWGHSTTSEANAAALSQCERHMGADRHQCMPVLAFTQCAAQAAAYHGDATAVAEGATARESEASALESCRNQSGDACSLRWSYCGDGSGQVFGNDHLWGAVARPMDGGGEAIMVRDIAESATALIEANWHCEQANKRPCETLFHFGQCAAYAESTDQNYFGWSRSPSLEEARAQASASCSQAAGSLCEVKLSHCQ